MFDPREKTALFIDGANLFATSKSLGFDVDYQKMLQAFRKREIGRHPAQSIPRRAALASDKADVDAEI